MDYIRVVVGGGDLLMGGCDLQWTSPRPHESI